MIRTKKYVYFYYNFNEILLYYLSDICETRDIISPIFAEKIQFFNTWVKLALWCDRKTVDNILMCFIRSINFSFIYKFACIRFRSISIVFDRFRSFETRNRMDHYETEHWSHFTYLTRLGASIIVTATCW